MAVLTGWAFADRFCGIMQIRVPSARRPPNKESYE